jgi:hypothetical protein
VTSNVVAPDVFVNVPITLSWFAVALGVESAVMPVYGTNVERTTPEGPVDPCGPVKPVGPVAPVDPVAPVGPVAPIGPERTTVTAKAPTANTREITLNVLKALPED